MQSSFYAQDQWTMKRLTLQGALRYDHAWSYYPEQQLGPTRFLPTPLVFPETQGVIGYNDIQFKLYSGATLVGTPHLATFG